MAHEQISDIASASLVTQPSCLLLSIAAELRNQIYELVFNEESDGPVELFKAQPPSNALLLACHAIYSEAALVYAHAYRKYWTKTAFMLTYRGQPSRSVIDAISTFREEDCHGISNIAIKQYTGHIHGISRVRLWTYIGDGFWKRVVHEKTDGQRCGLTFYDRWHYIPEISELVRHLEIWSDNELAEVRTSTAKESAKHATMKKMLLKHILCW
ncbi:hypothetical protein LTS10_009044 [Elasticomyces elasticus]|nr:hypothetical protein LTS10_009044 [Elasticomyces elasticus]